LTSSQEDRNYNNRMSSEDYFPAEVDVMACCPNRKLKAALTLAHSRTLTRPLGTLSRPTGEGTAAHYWD